MGVGAALFGIRRTVFDIGDSGTVESIVVFEMEGEWTCLAEIWLDEELSDTRLETGLLTRAWSIIRGNLVLNSIAISSTANLASLINIYEIDDGSEASMSKLMATLSCLLVGVVCV